MLIYSDINTSGNLKNEKQCVNTTPTGGGGLLNFDIPRVLMKLCINTEKSFISLLKYSTKTIKLLQRMSDGKFSVLTYQGHSQGGGAEGAAAPPPPFVNREV